MNVLIVEDEAFVAFDIATIIADGGHTALGPATTIEHALALAPRADIAFVDLGLHDGPGGAQLARRLIDRHGITVIFVTGNPERVREGFDGAFAVVGKPFIPDKLAGLLKSAVDFRSTTGKRLASCR